VIVRLFKVTEALLVATTISVGLSAGYSIISGSSPPDINTFITSVVPPYESDDKRIYPNILEDKELYPSEEHHE
tara:strand:+ start:58 stop:279 length:222 start_codon:yes stop_codon:yes gene_type:complete